MATDKTIVKALEKAKPTDMPLIFTSKGNIPEAALTYKTEWIVESTYILFSEQWFLDDELVKSNAHTYTNNPFGQLGVEQSTF